MIRLKKLSFLIALFLISFVAGGCGDLVEIQDRDFVLALGISYEKEQYQVTFSLPDLEEITDQSASEEGNLLRTYAGRSLPEIEQYYNANSENRLDYRHLQAIILDASVCTDAKVMQELLEQIDDNYDISHNVLVYFYEGGVKDLMGNKGVNGSIGGHLKKLAANNYVSGVESAKIGELINCISNDRILFIPALLEEEESVAVSGGIFFRENQLVKRITLEESEFYFITLGKGSDYLIRFSPDNLIQLKEVKARYSYELTEQGMIVSIKVTGLGRRLPANQEVGQEFMESCDRYIREQIELEVVEFMKNGGLDYLNLYEKSSYHNRQIWLIYQERLADFLEDADVRIEVDIGFE